MSITISIINFKSIEKKKFTFTNEEFVLLVGDNGCGKSTTLKAIEWCLYGTKVSPAKNKTPRPGVVIEFDYGVKIQRQRYPEYLEVIKNDTILKNEAAQSFIFSKWGPKNVWIATSFVKQKSVHPILVGSVAERSQLLWDLTFGAEEDGTSSKLESNIRVKINSIKKKIEEINGRQSEVKRYIVDQQKTPSADLEKLLEESNNDIEQELIRKDQYNKTKQQLKKYNEQLDKYNEQLDKYNNIVNSIPEDVHKMSLTILDDNLSKIQRLSVLDTKIKTQPVPDNINLMEAAKDISQKWMSHSMTANKKIKTIRKSIIDTTKDNEESMRHNILSEATSTMSLERSAEESEWNDIFIDFNNERKAWNRNVASWAKYHEATKELERYTKWSDYDIDKLLEEKQSIIQEQKEIVCPCCLEGLLLVKGRLVKGSSTEESRSKASIRMAEINDILVGYNNYTDKLSDVNRIKDKLPHGNNNHEYSPLPVVSLKNKYSVEYIKKKDIVELPKGLEDDIKTIPDSLDNVDFKTIIKVLNDSIDYLNIQREREELLLMNLDDYETTTNHIDQLKTYQRTINSVAKISALKDKTEDELGGIDVGVDPDQDDKIESIRNTISELKERIKESKASERFDELEQDKMNLAQNLSSYERALIVVESSMSDAMNKTAKGIELVSNKFLESIYTEYGDDAPRITIKTSKVSKTTGTNKMDVTVSVKHKGVEFNHVSDMSGGEETMISLALAVGMTSTTSGFLMLDEALSSLSSEKTELVMDSLRMFASDKTVINVLHQCNTGIYDRVIEL